MDIRELADREEIRAVVLRYFRAMDRVDDELGFSIFHEDGTGDYGADIFAGSGRDLIRWLNEYNRTLIHSHHQMSNCTIEVDGDRAVAETYVTATLVKAAGDGGRIVRRVYGRQLDRFSRRDGRWGIDHRFYRRDFFWEERHDDVWVADEDARMSGDPSYALMDSLRG